MAIPHSLKITIVSLLREKWINLLSILTIASALLIISIALILLYNVESATKRLPEKFSMVMYLEDNIQRDKVDEAMGALRRNRSVSSVKFISKEDALKELKAGLKNSSYILEGLDENPLPDSFEVRLKKDSLGPETVNALARDASRIPGIKEVDYGEKFLSTLHSLKAGVKAVGMVLIITLSAGIIFVCYSTVKILFYRRLEEIETFKLLGATKGFIRTPFLIEGALIGLAAGCIGLIALVSIYNIVLVRLTQVIPFFHMLLFPAYIALSLPAAGLFLGVAGAAVALGRLKY